MSTQARTAPAGLAPVIPIAPAVTRYGQPVLVSRAGTVCIPVARAGHRLRVIPLDRTGEPRGLGMDLDRRALRPAMRSEVTW